MGHGREGSSTTPPRVEVDVDGTRPGWAVVSLTGAFTTSPALRLISVTLLRLYGEGVDAIAIDASGCSDLSLHVGQVLVDASAHAREAGGCLVVTGLASRCRGSITRQDRADALDLLTR